MTIRRLNNETVNWHHMYYGQGTLVQTVSTGLYLGRYGGGNPLDWRDATVFTVDLSNIRKSSRLYPVYIDSEGLFTVEAKEPL